MDLTRIGGFTYEKHSNDANLSNTKVCSDCRKYLQEIDFPIMGTWMIGALVEYLKNTPTFLAVFISLASLILSMVALFKDSLF